MQNNLSRLNEILKKLQTRYGISNFETDYPKTKDGKQILNVISKQCPYEQCDGTGWMLIQDYNGACYMRECECHYERQFTIKLKLAKVPLDFIDVTVSSFKTDIYKLQESQERARTAKEVAIKYVNNYREFKDLGKGLYLFSEAKGSGKTRLAVSILNALIKKYDIRGLYISSTDLLHEIKKTFDDSNHSAYEIIQQFTEAQLLVVDDFGVEKTTDWSEEMFTKILDDRMNYKRPTIITSNIEINQLSKKYRAGRIESRIEKMTFPVPLPNESVRSYLAQQENERIAQMI